MSRIAYVNGRYVPHYQAGVHIEDRGYQFADGVYEFFSIRRGKLQDESLHLDRLEYSLSELDIKMPLPRKALEFVLQELVACNRIICGMLYVQVTRGVAKRNHNIPEDAEPVLTATASPIDEKEMQRKSEQGISVITLPDLRWERCDIKAIGLLPNVLARKLAVEKKADDAWQVGKEGMITEASAANAWIVDENNMLRTHPVGNKILNGITRRVLCRIIEKEKIKFSETAFTPEEAYRAKEAFSTASSFTLQPVVKIDGHKIGDGKIGTITRKLAKLYGKYS